MHFFQAYLALPLLAVSSAQAGNVPRLDALNVRNAPSVVETYPVPDGVDVSTAFDVKVRVPGGPWKALGLYKPFLAEVNFTTGSSAFYPSSMAYFDFNGTVEVSATYNNDDIKTALVRPESFGILPHKTRHKVTFTLTEPRNVFLQVNGNVFDGLHLFTNRIEEAVPSKDDPNVIYYGPGLHKVSGNLDVASGQTVYVAGGAVLTAGGFNLENVTNASIRGHGVLLASTSTAISVAQSRNITLDGFIGINVLPRTYEANDVVVSNVRVISSVQYGDGIDIFSSNNILMDRVFLRTSDDSVAIYNHRGQ